MSQMRHVFYAGQLHGSYPIQEWIAHNGALNLPDGAYFLLEETRQWFIRESACSVSLNPSDVPAEVKTLCLLLGIPFQ